MSPSCKHTERIQKMWRTHHECRSFSERESPGENHMYVSFSRGTGRPSINAVCVCVFVCVCVCHWDINELYIHGAFWNINCVYIYTYNGI